MKRIFMLGIVLIVFIIFAGKASLGYGEEVPIEAWSAKYNGPGNSSDFAKAIAVDSDGNVYVTGHSWGGETHNDYATVKYDKNGSKLWARRYNGPGNDEDMAVAIVVDNSCNVYVTGYSTGNGSSFDYATIKYDANGYELWVSRYDKRDIDFVENIVLDEAGNVCVTGFSATIKYDSNGNVLWTCDVRGRAIAVDDAGNVYVGGDRNYNYATVKLDNNGNILWYTEYNGPAGGADYIEDITLDNEGNVIVTGFSGGNGKDFATIKYDNDGNERWVRRYDYSYFDEARAVDTDNEGNVYVCGISSSNYTTIKYDADGDEKWIRRHGKVPMDMVVDGAGNVYVTGYTWRGMGPSYFDTIKYDTYGNELWSVQYYSGEALALDIDESGNVYVTGWNLSDYTTIKYVPPVIQVNIDIKPGSDPNSINLGEHGLLPVAILGTPEFDVETINPETIEIEGVSLAERDSKKTPKLAYSLEDVDGDGFADMITFFDVQTLVTEGVLEDTTIALTLTATLYDGTPIKGTDSVNIVH